MHGHGHGQAHGHGHGSTGDAAARALGLSVVLHAVFMVVEAVAGWWSGSLALLSDAGHMLSDVGALLLAWFAQRLREREPDPSYTFGLRRLPVLGGLVNGISLLAIVVLVVVEAVERFDASPTIDGMSVLVVGVLGLIVNLVGAWWLYRSGDQSVNVRGALLHVLADALGSVAAVLSAIVILTTGWTRIDAIASVVIALLILLASLPLLRDALHILLQRAPVGLDVTKLRASVDALPSVVRVRDLHVWQLDSGQTVASLVVVCRAATLHEASVLADTVRKHLHDTFDVDHATVELRAEDAPAPHHHF
ncbi:MAG: cation transporter [Sandaracinus sp.]|nr:cation transporter [Myxococcales bacterium]MCB9611726.1 cation transporter [Sandaracinus sp.]MCB9636549.1 cation transporter [Sandaracinus sp.]